MVLYGMDKYVQLRSQGIDPYANQTDLSSFVPMGEPQYVQLGPLQHSYQDPFARAIQASPVGQAVESAKQVVVDAAGNVVGVITGAVNQGASNFKQAYNLQSGSGQEVIQPISVSVAPATQMPTSSGRIPSSVGYQNVVQPSVGMVSSPITYGRASPSYATQTTQITYAPGRTPIMDGTTTVGFTEVAADGSQRVYYVVAGYPKPGMPKPGTYRVGATIPRAMRQGYNVKRKRVKKVVASKKQSKSVSAFMKSQNKAARRWI